MHNEEQRMVARPLKTIGERLESEDHLRDANEPRARQGLTAQKWAEESADRYRDLVEGLDAIVWEANVDPWQYTFVSQRAQVLFGYPVERWLREPRFWTDLIHPEDRAQAVNVWQAAASAREDFRVDYRVMASDGRIMWVSMIAHVRQPAHRPAQFRGLLLDVGDSIRAGMLQTLVAHQTAELRSGQEQLRALATELSLSEHRERAKLAMELHDHLAQLLVLGRLKLGQAKRLPGVVFECADFIEQADDVLSESLAYTRTLITDLSPPVLREYGLFAALGWLAQQMLRYQLTVNIELPDMPPLVITEEQGVMLFQSVRELLINISKHAHVDTATVRVRYQRGIVHLEVEDAGCGFDLLYAATSTLAAVSTTSPSSKFGLFAIRERMKALGGRFEVRSTQGKGTTATLILPLAMSTESAEVQGVSREAPTLPSSYDPATSSRHAPQDHTVPSIRVLLVDDHVMLREGLRSVINACHNMHVVAEASNGLEAIDAVRLSRPDVVVMDINMPQMNGIEATTRITQEFPQAAVIGLSVQQGTDEVQKMKDAGACAYLMKECAVDELCQAIEAAMTKVDKKGEGAVTSSI